MKKLAYIVFVKKLLLLIILLLSHANAASEKLLSSNFTGQFPDAAKMESSYYFQLDECNIIAVENPLPPMEEIAIIFVQSKNRTKSQSVAQRLVQLFNLKKETIVPFEGNDASIAIICEVSELPTKSPLHILLTTSNTKNRSIKFIGWQGASVKAKVDLSTLNSNSSKKHKGNVDMLVNLTESRVSSAAFYISKGRMDTTEIQDFITTRMCPISSSDFSTSSLSAKSKRELKRSYSNYDIISYSSSYDFCIAAKSKLYYAGTLDGVKTAVSDSNNKTALDFSNHVLNWPGEKPQTTDSSDEKTAVAENSEDTTNYKPSGNVLLSPNGCIDFNGVNSKLIPGNGFKEGRLTNFRLDDSRVLAVQAMWMPKINGTKKLQQDLMIMFVTSSKGKEDSMLTAQHLAKLLPGDCTIQPFEDAEPTQAIFMPSVKSLDADKDSVLRLLLYPRPGYEKTVRFLGWKDGLLISKVLVSDDTELEVTLNPAATLTNSVINFRATKNKVDMRNFLSNGRLDGEFSQTEQPEKFDKELKGNWAASCGQLLLISLGNEEYRLGTPENLLKAQKKAYTAAARDLAKTARKWPDGPTQRPESKPTPSAEEQQIVNIPESTDEGGYERIKRTWEQDKGSTSPDLTPEQAYKDYLESLKKM